MLDKVSADCSCSMHFVSQPDTILIYDGKGREMAARDGIGRRWRRLEWTIGRLSCPSWPYAFSLTATESSHLTSISLQLISYTFTAKPHPLTTRLVSLPLPPPLMWSAHAHGDTYTCRVNVTILPMPFPLWVAPSKHFLPQKRGSHLM